MYCPWIKSKAALVAWLEPVVCKYLASKKRSLPIFFSITHLESFWNNSEREVWFPDLDLILISLIFNCKSWSSNQENLILKSWFPDLHSIHQIKSWSSRKPDFQENLIFKYRFPDLTLNKNRKLSFDRQIYVFMARLVKCRSFGTFADIQLLLF